MSDDSGEPNIFAFLSGIPEVTALADDRIYHQRIPQHVFGATGRVMDCAVYQKVGGVSGVAFCGADGLVPGQYQIDAYSPDDVRYAVLARAIRRALVDYSGPMGGVSVRKVVLDNDFDAPEPEPGLYRRTQTYTIWYLEG